MSDAARDVFADWRLPWFLTISIVLTAVIYVRGWWAIRRTRPGQFDASRLFSFLAGLAVLWLAIGSPMDGFADALLSAHMVEHLALMMFVPPLVLYGWPTVPLLRGLPRVVVRWIVGPLLRVRGLRLALACLAVPLLRQQAALDATAQAIAASAPAAQTALALRHQLATTASGRAAIIQARRTGDALQVLATLTSALPDGTWLSDLALKSGDLTIDGQSTNAARLIGLLSAVPDLRDPNFTAPVTRTADGKADQFSLHAGIAE